MGEYDALRREAIPLGADETSVDSGANCQRFAYAVLSLFGLNVPPYRSSELWEDAGLEHPLPADVRGLDLVLFNSTPRSWGAHVAIFMAADELLHLCAEVGKPSVWSWHDFESRPRYRSVVGIVRIPR